MKQTYGCLLFFSLGLQACSTGSTTAMAAEGSRNSTHREQGNARLAYIKVEPVRQLDVAPAVRLTGKVGFDENHTQRVASPIDGRASRILVNLGDRVQPGQALIELMSPQVSELQAAAQKARQDLDVSTKALERARILKADGAVSEKEAALVEANFRKDRSDVARADAQLESMRISSSDPTTTVAIRAQIGGTIVERNVLLGQEVRDESAEPLFTISALDTVWVEANVQERDIGIVHQGDLVKISVPAYGNETFEGKVDHISDVLDPGSRTAKLRCTVHNPNFHLKPEMFATIDLTDTLKNKALVIPASAVLTDSEHVRVFVAGEDNVYRQRVVTIGSELGDDVYVLGGVHVGDRIVTQGAIFLSDGLRME